MGTVSREDYGKKFTPSLAEIIMPITTSVPTMISLPSDGRYQQSSMGADLELSHQQADDEAVESNWEPDFEERTESCLRLTQSEQIRGHDELDFDQFIDLS